MRRSGTSLELKQASMRERYGALPEPPAVETAPTFAERHYTPREIAEMWSLSVDVIRRLFEHEAGVLIIGDNSGGHGKRRYRTARVPQSVLERVHRRLSKVGA